MSVEMQRLNADLRDNPGLVSELLAAGAEFYTLADKAAQKGYSVTPEDLRTTQDGIVTKAAGAGPRSQDPLVVNTVAMWDMFPYV